MVEFSDAASFFDTQPVLDAYTGATLFMGQPDLYDATVRDAETGWRRTLSAATVVFPARGCVQVGNDRFIAGRSVRDYFQGEVAREYVLLHPTDQLIYAAFPAEFLAGGLVSVSFYAGLSWLKERKAESITSETSTIYDVYCSVSETSVREGVVLKTQDGNYLKVLGADLRSGGLMVLVAYELGVDALRPVSYTAAGAYDPVADSSSASAPNLINAFVEDFQSNYRYRTSAATKYERADKVVTVRMSDLANPKPGDILEDQGEVFRVLERQADPSGCWELHVRPV